MSSFPHTSHQAVKRGNFLRSYAEALVLERELGRDLFHLRGKAHCRAQVLADPDIGDFRADNTCGWKARKHRHQWEHRVLAAEKREKNRRKKAGVDYSGGLAPEVDLPRRKSIPEEDEA